MSQQVHQPMTDLLLAEPHANSLVALASADLPEVSAPDRPSCEAEASQMEMSPAPTIGTHGKSIILIHTKAKILWHHPIILS